MGAALRHNRKKAIPNKIILAQGVNFHHRERHGCTTLRLYASSSIRGLNLFTAFLLHTSPPGQSGTVQLNFKVSVFQDIGKQVVSSRPNRRHHDPFSPLPPQACSNISSEISTLEILSSLNSLVNKSLIKRFWALMFLMMASMPSALHYAMTLYARWS